MNTIFHTKESFEATSLLGTELQQIQISVRQILQFLKTIRSYLKAVNEGKIKGNVQIGRYIMDTIYSLPLIDSASLGRQTEEQMLDVKAAMDLIRITKKQLQLTDKLQVLQ